MALVLPGRGGALTGRANAEERALARRLDRLRDELTDEQVPLPLDSEVGATLLREILYARQPPVHEQTAPRYGSVVAGPAWGWRDGADAPIRVDLDGVPEALSRRLADGSGSFLVVGPAGIKGLACFAHPVGYEATLARLGESAAATVVQRTGDGAVRIFTSDGVVEWDAVRWSFKPHARFYEAPVRRLAPAADAKVLRGLLEFSAHWLSPGGVGATLVWYLDAAGLERSRGVDLGHATPAPALRLTRHEHFPALLSVLGQMDRAALLDPDGEVSRLGAMLVPSDRAIELVAPTGGTRHTSARRFSYDEPRALVFVVSEDGPVSVFSDGARAASVRADPCQSDFLSREEIPSEPDPAGERIIRCPRCGKALLVDEVRIAGWTGGPERLPCPVCGETQVIDAYRAAIRGVSKELP